MELGFVGLGQMGANMVRRLLLDKHRIVAYNRTAEKTREIMTEGAEGAFTLAELVAKLAKPRAVWVMVPSGDATESMIDELLKLLEPGDTIVDGGNSNFHDSVRRHAKVKATALDFVDAGVSGGVWGLKIGYCLMVGGEPEPVKRLEPIFRSLAPEDGYLHAGGPGAGHYVKMIHNGIEYGMMQAYAEGFEILHASDYKLDLAAIADLWNHGSVVRSWLLELAAAALSKDQDFSRPRAGSPTPARAAGPSRRRSTGTFRRRSSPSPLQTASAPARTTATAPRCWRRCATSSAATP